MHSFSFLVALLFASVVTSYATPNIQVLKYRENHGNGTSMGNNTMENSITCTCKKMAKLTKLTNLANNQTKLDAMIAKGKLNATGLAELRSKAANASTELQTMQSNTTLVGECDIYQAHKKDVKQCKRISKLTKLAAMANNQTALDAYVAEEQLNATQVTKLQQKIANATTTLQEMTGNTTLTEYCAQQQQKQASGCELTLHMVLTLLTNKLAAQSIGSSAGTSGGATAAADSMGGAASLSIQTISYTFFPALASLFVFLL
jgi:hypothetical protein